MNDHDAAESWYAELLGRSGNRPMPEVAEWMFPRGGGLQLYHGPERAGHCSVTLAVSDIEQQVERLAALKIDTSQRSSNERVKTVMIKDPDGNSLALAEALDDTLAR